MKIRMNDVLSETLGTALGSTLAVVAVVYGGFALITRTLESVF
ncbi:MAG: hypothetical protein O2944_09660 [Proteobacteria bacterium]|nr:hypothetical protein [Pseudomonadota bacterium]